MTVAVPVHESRVAPVLDVAREVLVVDVREGEEAALNSSSKQPPRAPQLRRELARWEGEL